MNSPGIRWLTFTGQSGSGKTTLVRKILAWRPNDFRILTSIVTDTRLVRPEDLPGEYVTITTEQFAKLEQADQFVWTAEHGGNRYGTLREDLKQVLSGSEIYLSILVLERVLTAHQLASGHVLSFFVTAPTDQLRLRLRGRGDSEASIANRLETSKRWMIEAANSGLPYTFIQNLPPTIDEAFAQVKKELSLRGL